MKKRLCYKMLKSFVVQKGYTAKEKRENLAEMAKKEKAIRTSYHTYLRWRKKGVRFTIIIKKDGYIDDDDL